MERAVQKAGVSGLVVAVGVIVVLYSLWGASVMHAKQAGLSEANSSVAANL